MLEECWQDVAKVLTPQGRQRSRRGVHTLMSDYVASTTARAIDRRRAFSTLARIPGREPATLRELTRAPSGRRESSRNSPWTTYSSRSSGIVRRVLVLDESGDDVAVVTRFLSHLADSGYSPNTLCAYAYDLRHLASFLDEHGLTWSEFRPSTALSFLAYPRRRRSSRPAQRLGLTMATGQGRLLSPATVARALAATSSFFEWAMTAIRNPAQGLQRRRALQQRSAVRRWGQSSTAGASHGARAAADAVAPSAEHPGG